MFRKIALVVVGIGLVAGVVLATTPLHYEAPEAHERVSCGTAIWPKWPPPPPGTDDECDAVHIGRWIALAIVVLPSALIGGSLFFASRRHARRA